MKAGLRNSTDAIRNSSPLLKALEEIFISHEVWRKKATQIPLRSGVLNQSQGKSQEKCSKVSIRVPRCFKVSPSNPSRKFLVIRRFFVLVSSFGHSENINPNGTEPVAKPQTQKCHGWSYMGS